MCSKFLLPLVVLVTSTAFGQGVQRSSSPASQPVKNSVPSVGAQQHEGDGTRIFQQNCSRCHNIPESFSPRISGTIIRHMRVRASLSKHDEQELLRFLNP